jgi:hypothetical protein
MRYYKPRLREYVSTQVDMPWEFLQGVAEQKQKGYDTALATGDTASKLLNFEVNPGDVQAKNEIQKKYNDRIMKIQDYIQSTGDFNAASREFTGIIRDIAQDPYINNMKAAVPLWKEQQKEKDKLISEGEILDFNNTWDYMYSTVDPNTGITRSYNQQLPYKGRTLGKAVYDDFKDAIDGKVIQTWGDRVEKINGEWVYKETGKRLGQDLLPIMQTAGYEISGRYPNYFRDRTKYEIKQGVSKENETPKWLQSLMGGLASEYHVDNVKKTYDTDWQYEYLWKKQQDKLAEQPAIPVEDVGIKSEGKVFDVGKTTYTYQKPIPGKDANYNVTEYRSPYKLKTEGKLPDNEWHMMGNYLMKSNPSLWNKVFGEGLGSKATQGELQQAYEQFKNYHDILYAAAGSNAKVRAVTNPTDLHAMFGGVKKADLTLTDLMDAPGVGGQAYVYDLTNNKFLTVEELRNQIGDKKFKVNINKEVLPYNGFNIVAEGNGIPNPDQFVTGYGFTLQGPSGEGGNAFIIGKPPEYRDDNEIAANRLYSAKLIPGEVKEVIVDGKKVYAVYDPDIPLNDFALARQQGQDVGGKIYVYKTKDAANRLSRNPNDFILEPQGTRDDPNYIYLSDPVNVLMNLKEKLKEEKNK